MPLFRNLNLLDAVNFQSLKLVRDELVATIEEGANHLDSFADDENIFAKLAPCTDCISQVIGTLKLIEFDGAELLAQELLATVKTVSPTFKKPRHQRWLDVTSQAFIVLTRYIDYVQQTEKRLPMLLIPQINELRKFRGTPSLPEGYFFRFELTKPPVLPKLDEHKLSGKKYIASIRRIRYMYQIGLIGFIRERQLESSIILMRRGLKRARRITGNEQPLALLWWLADVALRVFHEQKMQSLETRKLLFARIERIIRQVEKNGTAALNAHLPKEIIKELIYLIAISSSDRPEAKLICKTYGLEAFPHTDKELARQRNLLHGPSLSTVKTLVDVLKSELASAKEILETASYSDSHEIDDLEAFVGTLKHVADTLLVIGKRTASDTLKDLTDKAANWQGRQEIETEEIEEVVNTLLYLDTVVDAIAHAKLNDETLEEANKIAQSEAIASGLLSDGKRIAISEMKSSLVIVKTALSDFKKTNFETVHITNIANKLAKVRGAALIMNCNKAASVLARSAKFVEEVLVNQKPVSDMEEKLEAFADAIISVEYYLNSANGNFQMDESILALAEESLEALGYSESSEK